MKRLWTALTTPTSRFALGSLLLGGILLGAGGLVAFDVSMHETSTDQFCLSCHELQVNIGYEYDGVSHAKNRHGIRVSCADCHLPKPFVPKMKRKIRALGEIYHHLAGTIDTPEKFEAHRMKMATRVWAELNQTDSRECRNCHKADLWDVAAQSEKARDYHNGTLAKGKTCIDCHKGVAHRLPEGIEPDEQLPGMDPAREVAGR
jgi:cytochrome c-type protein NapC